SFAPPPPPGAVPGSKLAAAPLGIPGAQDAPLALPPQVSDTRQSAYYQGDQRVRTRQALIRQFQDEAAARYHNSSPWTFLSDLAAGMADSKSVSLPMMFAHGVGVASAAREKEREGALQDWLDLEKESGGLD